MKGERGQGGLNYLVTFITVSADCPVAAGVVPPTKNGSPSVAQVQYELLSSWPYCYTQEEILFETHARRLGLSEAELIARRADLWKEFFSKPQVCLRASPLPKRYGWGLHFDAAGRTALVAIDSPDYRRFAASRDGAVKVVAGMRSRRA